MRRPTRTGQSARNDARGSHADNSLASSSCSRHSQLFTAMTQGVIYLDREGRITSANPAAERILGLTRDQLTRRTSFDPRWKTLREDGSNFPAAEHPAIVALRSGQAVAEVMMGIFHPVLEQHRWILVSATPNFHPGESLPFEVLTTFTDITELKRHQEALLLAQQELVAKDALLRHVVDNLPQHLFWKGRDGTFRGCNSSGARAVGLKSPEEIVGKTDYDLYPNHSDGDFFFRQDMSVMESGPPLYHKLSQKQESSGAIKWLDVTKVPLRDARGNVDGLLVSYEDVTNLNQIEESLRKFKQVVEQSPDAIIIAGLNGNIEYVNPAFCRSYGYSAQEVLGQNPRLLKSEHTPAEEYYRLWQRIREGQVWQGELLNRKKDGSLVWQSTTVSPIFDDSGVTTHFLSIQEDISARKHHEIALRAVQQELTDTLQQLSIILDNAQVGIAFLRDDRLIWVNRRLLEMFGYAHKEMLEKSLDIFFPVNEDFRKVELESDAVLAQGKPYETERLMKRKNGRAFWGHLRGMAVDARNLGKGSIWTLMDIDSRKSAEQELLELNSTLAQRVCQEIANGMEKERLLIQQARHAAMGEMIGNIAHQWRQPLSVLGLILQNVGIDYEDNELTGESLQIYIEDAMRAIRQMSGTIDDFRNFFNPSRQKINFNLRQAIDETLDLLSASLKNHNIAVQVSGPDHIEIHGHQNEFSQMLLNLIGNAKDALDARKPGKPAIAIEMAVDDQHAIIRVHDNAGGVAPEIAEKIFDPYFTTKEKGTGIGLYMTKTILEKHMHGSIAFRNGAHGAEFTIRLPLGAAFTNSEAPS